MYERYTGLTDTTQPAKKKTAPASTAAHSGASGSARRYDDVSGGDSSRSAYSRSDASHRAYSSSAPSASSSRSRADAPRGSGGSSGGSSASSQRRRAAKQRRQRRRRIGLLGGTLFLIALMVLAIILISRSCNPVEQTPVVVSDATLLAEGVTIDGVGVGLLDVGTARAQLNAHIQEKIDGIAITLQHALFTEVIRGADMNISTDMETVLMQAGADQKANTAYTLTLSVDYPSIDERILAINSTLTSAPVDASFTVTVNEDSGEPVFTYTEGTDGQALDVEQTEEMVRACIEQNNWNTTLNATLIAHAPAVTVASLKEHTALIGSFTTSYRYKASGSNTDAEKTLIENRSFNVRKGAGLINNIVVQPGKTFSFNDTVGARNERNGWKEANGITGGKTYSLQYGGGICQVSTTLYNALLRANIEIVSRREHSIPSDYVELGLDATVDTGNIDFKFRNDTDYPLYIFAYITANKSSGRHQNITVQVYGQALPDGVTYEPVSKVIDEWDPDEPIYNELRKEPVGYDVITVNPHKGYKVEVYLNKYQNGTLVEEVYLYTDTYDAIREEHDIGTMVVETPTPEPTDTPEPTQMPNTEE